MKILLLFVLMFMGTLPTLAVTILQYSIDDAARPLFQEEVPLAKWLMWVPYELGA